MEVNQLIKKLEQLDPNMPVVLKGADHQYFDTMAEVETAHREEDGSLTEADSFDSEGDIQVLVIW